MSAVLVTCVSQTQSCVCPRVICVFHKALHVSAVLAAWGAIGPKCSLLPGASADHPPRKQAGEQSTPGGPRRALDRLPGTDDASGAY